MLVIDQADVEACGKSRCDEGMGLLRSIDDDRIKERRSVEGVSLGLESRSKVERKAVDVRGNGLKTVGAVVDGVEGVDHGRQYLSRADVGRGFVSADVLFARLKSQTVDGFACGINSATDKTTWHLALEVIAHRHEGCVRTTEAHGHTETLSGTYADIGAKGTRFFEEREGQEICGGDAESLASVDSIKELGKILCGTQGIRVLDEDASEPRTGAWIEGMPVAHDELVATHGATRANDFDGLRMAGIRDEKRGGFGLRSGKAKENCFRCGSGFVKERCIGDGETREGGHKRLEIHEGFQTALRNFRLVRRVGSVPAGIFKHVADNDGRGKRAVVALADERLQQDVFVEHAVKFIESL
jgi:hypothetical protein